MYRIQILKCVPLLQLYTNRKWYKTCTLRHESNCDFRTWLLPAVSSFFFFRIISSVHCALYCGRIVSVDGTFKTFLLVCKMTFSSNLFWQFSRANAPHTLNLLGIQSYVVWTRGTQIKSTGPSSCCLLQSENPTWCCKAAGFTSNTALHIMTVWRSVKCSVEHGRLPVLTDGLHCWDNHANVSKAHFNTTLFTLHTQLLEHWSTDGIWKFEY